MFERTLGRFRSLIRSGEYLLSIHALEEMAEDDVLTENVENVILTGGIVERQIDRATRERKYVFLGRDLAGGPIGVVAKIGAVGKVVVLTVYREETS
ncbi:MAG: hypothetical protein BVN28_03115 [Nitrospira sp. ST-bin4]|nr:MAG: hypothetical protein BVN28_03115 [Nitrospira sp. ST-bin4]